MLLPADLKANYLRYKEEIDLSISKVVESGWYILGSKVKSFEKHFAQYNKAAHCIGLASGTDAVQFALRAAGIKAGDKVITTTYTAVATVSAIDWIGAVPILVDIAPDSYNLDPEKVEATIQSLPEGNINGIVVVHLYGHPADMEAFKIISKKYNIPLIEDCAQAHGAEYRDQKVGTIGICGAFSFYPTKNLGAFGDAGAIITQNESIAEKIRLLQQYGWKQRYITEEIGYNSRLDELQAAILDVKLRYLDEWNSRRREIAELYDSGLEGLDLELPIEQPDQHHVYHQYVIRAPERDKLKTYLQEHHIITSILYPQPVHNQPAYRDRALIGKGGMEISEKISQEILCLPIYPEVENSDIELVIETIKNFYRK